MICGQCVHSGLQSPRSKHVLLWSQRTFPKRNRGEAHPRPARADQDIHALRHEQVEENDPNLLMAICHETCQRRSQRYTEERKIFSPLELFSGIKVAPKLRHFHSFGCPTYVLDNALQSGQGAPKCDSDPGSGCTSGHHPIMQDQWP